MLGGRGVLRQALRGPWPILEPQCNVHSAPFTLFGEAWWEDVTVRASLFLEEPGVGAAVAARVRRRSR